MSTEELLAQMREARYRQLKQVDPDLFRASINAAESIVLNHRLIGHGYSKLAADIEWAVIEQVCAALRLPPVTVEEEFI